jgi:tetratricopeptide (TPR) repeat protein
VRIATFRPAVALFPLIAALAAGPAAADSAPRQTPYRGALRGTAFIVTPDGSGTGWLLDRDRRLVVTNHHVVGRAEVVQVVFPSYEKGKVVAERSHYRDGAKPVRGTVVDSDPARDLALVELDAVPAEAAALPLAADSPDPGERVHSVGNPSASEALWVYTSGTVRQVYRKEFLVGDQPVAARVVETQSPINPGDSGGPVVNDAGQVVGVTAARSRSAQLVSVCIDVTEVRTFVAEASRLLRPRTAAEFHRRGARAAAAGRRDRAVADYTLAIQLDPKSADAFRGRALCFAALGDPATAVEDLTAALRLTPNDAAAYRDRGRFHLRLGDPRRAVTDLTEAVRLNPQDAPAFNYCGLAREAIGDASRAVEDFTRALTLDPNYAVAYFNRGDVHRARGDLDAAAADFTAALALVPGMPVVLRARAAVYSLRGDHDRAIADCTAALEVDARDPLALTLRGAAWSHKGDLDRAIADYSRAIELAPKLAAAWKSRAAAWRLKRDAERAATDLAEAYRLDPSLRTGA